MYMRTQLVIFLCLIFLVGVSFQNLENLKDYKKFVLNERENKYNFSDIYQVYNFTNNNYTAVNLSYEISFNEKNLNYLNGKYNRDLYFTQIALYILSFLLIIYFCLEITYKYINYGKK